MKNSINFNIMTNMNQKGIKSIKITATVEKTINIKSQITSNLAPSYVFKLYFAPICHRNNLKMLLK